MQDALLQAILCMLSVCTMKQFVAGQRSAIAAWQTTATGAHSQDGHEQLGRYMVYGHTSICR